MIHVPHPDAHPPRFPQKTRAANQLPKGAGVGKAACAQAPSLSVPFN